MRQIGEYCILDKTAEVISYGKRYRDQKHY